MARPRTELGCVRCQRTGVKHGASFPEGRICRRCYQQALRRRGPCSNCHETRLLPGQTETGLLLCRDCAGIIQDFHCRQCGEEDEPHREGRCARCCLRELLAGILDDGRGAVNEQLLPLHEAICAQARPRSAIIWLRNPAVRQLLSDLATGRLPIEHASFEAHPSPQTATHLRDLLVEQGILDPINRDLALFEGWLERTLSTIDDPDHRALLRRYATWHHLRRARTLAAAGRLRPGYIDASRQSISVAAEFLDFLAARGRTLQKTRQADIDAWLAGGPTTRTSARTFVRWAIRHQHIPKLDFPYRTAKMTPVLGQQERLALLRELLDNDPPRPLPHRTAGLLLLLYAQPINRIAALRIDQLGQDEHGATITFDKQPVPIPEPFAAVITEHRHNRPNMNTATNVGSAWLFPGYRAGQHIHPSYLRTKLRDSGIHLLGARNAALRSLVLSMPPALVAEALGYDPKIAEKHGNDAGATWVTYASYRRTALPGQYDS
jgi:hypothetical protein